MLTHFMLQRRGAGAGAWLEKPVFPVITFGVVLLSLLLPLQLQLQLPAPSAPPALGQPLKIPLKDQVNAAQSGLAASITIFGLTSKSNASAVLPISI